MSSPSRLHEFFCKSCICPISFSERLLVRERWAEIPGRTPLCYTHLVQDFLHRKGRTTDPNAVWPATSP